MKKSKYDKTVYGIGYIGEGIYKSKIDGKQTIQYQYWFSMLRRCYYKKSLEDFPTYKLCEVCEEWLNFQTFSKWFDENFYSCNDERMELDKDIICKGNKIYSPDTCVFVPQRINYLFTKSNASRGEYPIGVNLLANGKFKARCGTLEKRITIGTYNTPENAFYDGYKPFKEDYIKKVANEYKDIIPQNLYTAMMNYVVEIDD